MKFVFNTVHYYVSDPVKGLDILPDLEKDISDKEAEILKIRRVATPTGITWLEYIRVSMSESLRATNQTLSETVLIVSSFILFNNQLDLQ